MKTETVLGLSGVEFKTDKTTFKQNLFLIEAFEFLLTAYLVICNMNYS